MSSEKSFGARYFAGLVGASNNVNVSHVNVSHVNASTASAAPARARLAEAVVVLRAELAREWDAVPPADRDDAMEALDELRALLADPDAELGRLRRRIGMITDALAHVPSLTAAVTALVAALPQDD
ncbi:DUF5955 family protein [Streptomyces sp. NBC_01803]|uniref:DUF5955 family protein n=1 Tax=Streptomyces sp. NBC_01803 TaxID=2975946 RepID=UPI002DD9CC31|nr:DUF5955 family protein [Streptomyces sp. NBC_01803]WSA43640.1 DUF5955 family protein [Streptomyces sp. NBC_01803]